MNPAGKAGPASDPLPGHSHRSAQQGSGRQKAACNNRLCGELVDDSGLPATTRYITSILGGVSVDCHRFNALASGVGVDRVVFSNN